MGALDKGGLTLYENSIGKYLVIIRAFTLIMLFNEFCELAFRVCYSYKFADWEESSELNAFKIGQLIGSINELSDIYDDEFWNYYYDKFGSSYGFEMALDSILMDLVQDERYKVFDCIAKNIGPGEENTIFNISYMNFYRGKEDDIMAGNFRYVREKGDGGEKQNFAPWIVDGREVCYGLVEQGFTKGDYEKGRQRQMHIQKIKDAGNPGEKLDNVLVVWCAKLPESKHSVIVGWYKDATVYRNVNLLPYDKDTDRGLPEFGYWHNVVADKENCVLLPIEERKRYK